MTSKFENASSRFESEARYRIVVQGTVPTSWANRLAGMEINTGNPGDSQQRSILEGVLRDQSELNGVLESLYRLHLVIVDVEQLEE